MSPTGADSNLGTPSYSKAHSRITVLSRLRAIMDGSKATSYASSDGPADSSPWFGEAHFLNPGGLDFRLSEGETPCEEDPSPTLPGALRSGHDLRISLVQNDAEHRALRLRVTGSPGTKIALESTAQISPPSLVRQSGVKRANAP